MTNSTFTESGGCRPEAFCQNHGLQVKELKGIRPKFSTIPIRSYFSGVVPEALEFCISHSTLLAYIGMAKKA